MICETHFAVICAELSRGSATDQPHKGDTECHGDKAGDPQLLFGNGGKQAGHCHKKTRGQCVHQPLDNQKERKSCQKLRHGCLDQLLAGTAGAAGAVAGGAPAASLKKRKNSEFGDSTMVVPLEPSD